MVRRMIATITQIESVVTPSGNNGHVIISYYRDMIIMPRYRVLITEDEQRDYPPYSL